MKALVKKLPERGLWLDEVPAPTCNENEVLIKVKKTSICGTDLHIYKWDEWAKKTVPVPLVTGHEFMGEIVEIGQNVKNLKIGERVCAEGHLVCGRCIHCRNGEKHLCSHVLGIGVSKPGCFAEYLTMPADSIFQLPDFISDDLGAIFDPFGNAVHAALSFNLVGEDVLVSGAGPIGIMAAAVAKKAGARTVVITDLSEYRLTLAEKMGVTRTVNITKESIETARKDLGIEEGFTVGLEMTGAPQALTTLIENMGNGGKIALLGLLPSSAAIDWELVIFKMLTLKGIYGREVFKTWNMMVHLLESGLDLSPIITHHFPYWEFEKAFEAAFSGQSGKIILNWQQQT